MRRDKVKAREMPIALAPELGGLRLGELGSHDPPKRTRFGFVHGEGWVGFAGGAPVVFVVVAAISLGVGAHDGLKAVAWMKTLK